jgi:hypothetical protein
VRQTYAERRQLGSKLIAACFECVAKGSHLGLASFLKPDFAGHWKSEQYRNGPLPACRDGFDVKIEQQLRA